MTFKISVQPAGLTFDVARDEAILPAAIRSGIGLPYGCRDGACGSCKSRLVEGRVLHGAHQAKALSAAEEQAGWILTCCAAPQTDCVVEARTVAGAGEYPPMKMPARVAALTRAAPDVAVMKLQLPANVAFKYRAGQYVEFILRDGARRSYSMATAPEQIGNPPAVELHLRHMPGGKFTDHVFGAMKEKDILRLEGPFGSFFLREDATTRPQADRAARLGHRLRADQGHHRAHAGSGHRATGRAVLGLPQQGRPVPARLGPSRRGSDAEPALRAGAVGGPARRRLAAAAPGSCTRP